MRHAVNKICEGRLNTLGFKRWLEKYDNACYDSLLNYSKNILDEFKLMYKNTGYDSKNTLAEVYVTYSKLNMGGESE